MTGRKDKRFKFKNPLKAIDSSISLCRSLFSWASFRSTKAGIKAHTIYGIKKRIPDFIVITDGRSHDLTAVSRMQIDEKTNTKYRTIKKNQPCGNGILRDDAIKFTGQKSKDYPQVLRLVKYKNPEDKKVYTYITNNTDLVASTIASIYKSRWDFELFFKWVKQNLKIKSFFGTSGNAVRTQIWTAAIAYLMMEYIRFQSRSSFSLIFVFTAQISLIEDC